jgi:hypothetical protein
MELKNAKRGIFKATYAPIIIENVAQTRFGAIDKANAIHSFAPQFAELAQLRANTPLISGRAIADTQEQPSANLLDAVQHYIAVGSNDPLGLARNLVNVAPSDVIALGHALAALRSQITMEHATTIEEEPLARSAAGTLRAIDAFQQHIAISPVGRLHLERIDMIPAGIERGELVGTVPMTPKETVTIVHKEWSIISQEFESIVTDQIENFSERGVTEKTELSQSTDSQSKHSSALDLSAQVSGSYGFVTFSASSKLDLNSSDELTRKDSRNHTESQTRKASLRTKKEHKVTIDTKSTIGKEETSTRTVMNPSDTNAMRIDYFSMIRKWRVQLYRYGLRMTYDIAIPEPGATFREVYSQINEIKVQLAIPFTFSVKPEDITPKTYTGLAVYYNVPLEAPPDAFIPFTVSDVFAPGNDGSWHINKLEFDIADGYVLTGALLDADLGNFDHPDRWFKFYGGPENLITTTPEASLHSEMTWLHGALGHQKLQYIIQNMDMVSFGIAITASVRPEVLQAWQARSWAALRQGALNQYYENAQRLQQMREQLAAQAAAGDTLTLRREENEEIMKAILRWLFGPSFHIVPSDISVLAQPPAKPGGFASIANPEQGHMDDQGWNRILHYGEMIKFLHEAIEWENVLYFLYPYFWDVPSNWDAARILTHPDPTRQAFLRAGSARVVLTIRPGFEISFAALMETGAFSNELPPDHPYVTIGQEIQNYARTNYPGIPPANPGKDGNASKDGKGESGILIAEWFEYTPSSGIDIALTSLPPATKPVDIA